MKLQYIVFIFLVIIKFSQSRSENEIEDDYFRLPTTVIPKHYTLKIQTFLEPNNFKHISSVQIQIHCVKPTNKITLHSRNLEIKNVKLIDDKFAEIAIEKKQLEPEYDFLHIYLNDNLVKNSWYTLKVDFTGKIRRVMAGYYRSSYKDESGQTRWLATAKFEPTNARSAFPCFDEPALRARFSIQLGHKPHLTAISNMPVKNTHKQVTEDGEWVWSAFEETLKMPTYLISYTINDFGFETTTKRNSYGNTTINVWAPKKSLKQVKFATKISPKILSFFEKYFNIAYPLPKSDLLAVPDFPSGATESWGLISFRESKLLYEPGISTDNNKDDIVETMAHETAHYWFGNLVTIKWWAYLWLKEGFATYLARVAKGHLFPTLDIYANDDVISEMQAVYAVDALQTSRPVTIPIHNQNRIHEIYDSISYSKGSCIIRMIELFLGNKVLRKGLIQYLNKYKYGSTEPDDLWNSLTIAAHKDKSLSEKLSVKKIMDTWTLQPGFPLVTVDRNYNSGTVTVSQKRFLKDVRKHDDSCYWIPLTYTTKEESDFNSSKPKQWLSCPKENITFQLGNSESWILFNVQVSGLYRTNYDETNWKMLIKQLETNHKGIETIYRVILIDDVMELAMRGYVDFKIAFNLIKYIRQDEQFETWSRAIGRLMVIYGILEHTSAYELIRTFISNLIIPKYENFSGINIFKKFTTFQLQIINVACGIGNKICQQEAASIFLQWKQIGENYTIPLAIRSTIYCQGVKTGNEADWDYLWQHYLKSNVATEKDSILNALGCAETKELLVRYLEWMIQKDSGIRPQDALKVFASVAGNKVGADIARLFFYENVKEIFELQSPRGKCMKKFLIIITKTLRTDAEFNEYKMFLKENEQYFQIAQLTIKQTLEKLVILKHWNENIFPNLVHALEQQLKITKRSSSPRNFIKSIVGF